MHEFCFSSCPDDRPGRKSRRPMAGSIVDPIGMDAAALPPPGVDFGSEGAAGGTSTSSSPIPVPGSTTSSTGPRNHHHPAVMQSHHSEHMFTATGQIMTAAQRSEYCHRRGLCEGCGVRTHDIHGLGLVVSRPVTNENVYNGICKRCRPRRVRTAMERDGVELEADGAHMPVLAATNGSLTAGAIAEEAAGRLVDDVADESLNIDYIHRQSSTTGDGRNGSSGTEDARTSSSTGQGRKKSSRVSFLSSGTSSGGKLRDSFLSNDGSTGDDGFDAQGDGIADADDMNSDSEGQSSRNSSLHNSKATGASKRRFAKKLWKKAKHISMMAIPAGTSSKSLATDSCKSLALEEAVDDASRREPGEDMSMGSIAEAHDADGSDTPRKSAKSSLTEADESKHLLPVISTEKEALKNYETSCRRNRHCRLCFARVGKDNRGK